jgi:hypothetical protein
MYKSKELIWIFRIDWYLRKMNIGSNNVQVQIINLDIPYRLVSTENEH